jgi:hypothetical protein
MTIRIQTLLLGATAALALATAAPAADRSQLAANAGVSPAEAQQLTLTEIAAQKFSRDTENTQRVGIEPGTSANAPRQLAATAGVAPDEATNLDLTQIAARFFNRASSDQDQQTVALQGQESLYVMGTRQQPAGDTARQLARSAGLSDEEARGLSLRQIAAHAFNRGESSQDAQRVDLR